MGSDLWRLTNAKSRSISAENPTGEKGKGAMAVPGPDSPAYELGQGWKAAPCIYIQSKTTKVLADVAGPGVIESVWFGGYVGRDFIIRMYWDDQESPSVETPAPDFFASPWAYIDPEKRLQSPFAPLNSLMVAVNPNRGMNCFWEMPFRKHCRITIENINPKRDLVLFYQINYSLQPVPEDAGYFHAQFRMENLTALGKPYTILDDIHGHGNYVGTSMGFELHSNGWWGEGEIKFYIDGDKEFPTICGTGTEDYFGGSYNWDVEGKYTPYSTPYVGMPQVVRPDGLYSTQQRHSLYRWHVVDRIRFERDIRVLIDVISYGTDRRYIPARHNICSVAYWYQALPSPSFPTLPGRKELLIGTLTLPMTGSTAVSN